jgi:hypothetical protein
MNASPMWRWSMTNSPAITTPTATPSAEISTNCRPASKIEKPPTITAATANL